MIQEMVGNSQAGIYSLAYSLSQIMTLFNTALKNTVSPWIYRKIKDRQVEELPGVVLPTVILVACVNIFLIAFVPEAVAIFAPVKYHEAIWVIPPVAMSVYFLYLYPLFVDFEFYYEKTKNISLATLIGAGLNIILNYVCIRQFGYMAAGYTTLVCYGFYVFFHYVEMKRICKKEFPGIDVYNSRLLFLISVAFMVIGFAFLFSYQYTFLRYAMIVIVGTITLIKRKSIAKFIREIATIRK